MAFTAEEKEQIRYHLGYQQLTEAASLHFGQPVPTQTAYLIEHALNNLLPVAQDRVRRIVAVLDAIECKLEQILCQITINSVDGVQFAPDQADRLEREYNRWGKRLADVFGVAPYPFSSRYRKTGSRSIPVVRG